MKNLLQRNGFWYLRRSVPEPLRPLFGDKKDLWKSLGTKDRKEAERRFHDAMTKLNAEFQAAERAVNAEAEEAAQMASARADAALSKFTRLAGQLGLPNPTFAPADPSPEDRSFIDKALELGQLQSRPKSRSEAMAMIDQALEALAWEREHGWTFAFGKDSDGEPIWGVPERYLDPLTQFLEEQFEATKRSLEAIRAQFQDAADSFASGSVPLAQAEKTAKPGSLRSLVTVWTVQRTPARSSQADMKTALDRFERLNGPLPYGGVTTEHVRRFKEDLIRDTAIKNATKQKQWSMVRVLFTVAKDDGLLATDPFDQVKLGQLKDDAECREILTRDDLTKLFSSLEGEEWWLVRVALYTGARLGELCQLRKEDVTVEGGVTFLHIRDDAELGKTVKTRNSVRKVPIHRQLMEDGFAKWAASRPQDQLFPFTSAVASKRLLRRFKAVGLGEGKVVHSLRHTFIGAARKVMEEDYRERITGHKSQRVSRTYGDYADLRTKVDLVDFGL